MNIVNRKTFLKYPEGTIFGKGKPWYFNNLFVKGKTWQEEENYIGDFLFLDFIWPEGKDSGECFDLLEQSLKTGSSFNCNLSYGRDGCFDEEDLFIVFEKKDLLLLKKLIEEAIEINN